MPPQPSDHPIFLLGPKISQLKTFFERRGYPVSSATNSKAALEMINKKPPHLVLFELLHKTETGFFIDQLRENHPFTPLLILEHPSKAGDILSQITLGVHAYLPTPPDEQKLFATVNYWLRMHQAQKYASLYESFSGEIEKIKQYSFELVDKNEALEQQLATLKNNLSTPFGSLEIKRITDHCSHDDETYIFSTQTLKTTKTSIRLWASHSSTPTQAALNFGTQYSLNLDIDSGLKILGWSLNIFQCVHEQQNILVTSYNEIGFPPNELLWDGKNIQGRFIATANQEFVWRLLLQIDGSTYLVNELNTLIVPSPPETASAISGKFFAILPQAPQPAKKGQLSTDQAPSLQTDAELLSMLNEED